MKRTILAVLTAASLVAVTGCASTNRETVGTVGGAVVGGVVGDALFGSTLGTVGGAAAGAYVGNKASKR